MASLTPWQKRRQAVEPKPKPKKAEKPKETESK